jgi:hypothetical protein
MGLVAARISPADKTMMNRERRVVLDETGDLAATPGSEPWAVAVRLELQGRYHDWQSRRESVLRLVSLLDEHRGWSALRDRNGDAFASLEHFVAEPEPFGLGYDDQRVRVVMQAQDARPLMEHRRPSKDNDGNVLSPDRQGNSSAYLTARIARDRPDVLARMQAGEFRSVRAAAIEAGIITPTPRLNLPADIPGLARALRRRLSTDDLAALIVALREQGCVHGSSNQPTSGM